MNDRNTRIYQIWSSSQSTWISWTGWGVVLDIILDPGEPPLEDCSIITPKYLPWCILVKIKLHTLITLTMEWSQFSLPSFQCNLFWREWQNTASIPNCCCLLLHWLSFSRSNHSTCHSWHFISLPASPHYSIHTSLYPGPPAKRQLGCWECLIMRFFCRHTGQSWYQRMRYERLDKLGNTMKLW